MPMCFTGSTGESFVLTAALSRHVRPCSVVGVERSIAPEDVYRLQLPSMHLSVPFWLLQGNQRIQLHGFFSGAKTELGNV